MLNRSGYARYDESTSRYLEATSRLLLEDYRGDLRRLREAAGHDPKRERELLKQFKGMLLTSIWPVASARSAASTMRTTAPSRARR